MKHTAPLTGVPWWRQGRNRFVFGLMVLLLAIRASTRGCFQLRPPLPEAPIGTAPCWLIDKTLGVSAG